jgi:hypothetical protein
MRQMAQIRENMLTARFEGPGARPLSGRSPNRGAVWIGWLMISCLTALFALWIGYRLLGQPDWLNRLPAAMRELLVLLEGAAAFTLVSVWAALWWRRGRRAAPPAPAIDAEGLYALSPAAFEQYVGSLFRQKGYTVRVRGRSGDLGVDLEVTQPGGKRAVVQCKRYRQTVGPEAVRELYGTLIHEQAAHGFLITTAEISAAARAWARHKPLTLIDGATLAQIAAALHANTAVPPSP